MKIIGKIIILGVIITVLAACWGCTILDPAYIAITNQPPAEDENSGGLGLGDLNGNTHDYQKVVIDVANGRMLPERYLQFKDEEGRLRNIATARAKLDSAIIKKEFEEIKQWQEVIQTLNWYGTSGYQSGGRTGYTPVEQATNKPMIPVGIINNSSRFIKISKPLRLAGIELGPGKQTKIKFPIELGLNVLTYTEYEIGKSRSRNRTVNVDVSEDTKNLTISDTGR